jgi:hypothetical protein
VSLGSLQINFTLGTLVIKIDPRVILELQHLVLCAEEAVSSYFLDQINFSSYFLDQINFSQICLVVPVSMKPKKQNHGDGRFSHLLEEIVYHILFFLRRMKDFARLSVV